MRVFLNDKPVIGSSPAAWPLREGALPVVRTFDMAPLDAISISTSGGPITLKIEENAGAGFQQGNPVKVENLWVLNIEPGENKYISKVTVADRRWMWSYAFIKRSYNVRRNVGTKRLVANDQVAAVNPTASRIAYANWSLNNGTPWVALSLVQDVLKAVSEKERDFSGRRFAAKIDDRIGQKIKGLPIEDLLLDDQGDRAVQRALSYLPEAMVYVDYDGTVVVTSRATGDEKKVVEALIPEIVGEGHTDLVENRLIRPRAIDVYFTREVELRFDVRENASDVGTISVEPTDTRTLINVLPSQDYQLTTGDGVPAAQAPIAQGTWITFAEAFNYWGNLPFMSRNGSGRKLDHDILQRAFVPGCDLWALLFKFGTRPDENGTIKPWAKRYAACLAHYRTSYRIDPKYKDRIESVRAYRAATIDPVSGTRAPASAYGDYSVLYTQQTLLKSVAQGVSPDWIMNKTAYPSGGVLDSSAEVSPASVEVEDSDQGIIHINYMPNPVFGMNETVLPSQVQLDSIPTADISNRTRPIAFNSVVAGKMPPRLSPSFKLAVILTAVPAAPNSKQQLHRIRITPSDVRDLLPDSQTAGLSEALGPVMEIRVGPGKEVARVQWKDDRSTDIDKIFGLTDGEPNLQGLVINEGEPGDLANGASLNAIAKAEAARVYASLVDRFEGTMTGYMNGQVRPAGWISEVSHEVATNGAATTSVAMPPQVPQMSLFSFLDSSSRASILRLVQPER